MNVIFRNNKVLLREDGSYILSWGTREGPKCEERWAENADLLNRAKRARELGLPVPDITPVWKVSSTIPVGGTLEEIKEILQKALEWQEHRRDTLGKKVKVFHSYHPAGCYCGYCPGRFEYSEEEASAETFFPPPNLIPEEWYKENSRTEVRVQSSDGRYIVTAYVAGECGSGSLLHPKEAENLGLPEEVLYTIRKLNADNDRKRTNLRLRKDAEELSKLAEEFDMWQNPATGEWHSGRQDPATGEEDGIR